MKEKCKGENCKKHDSGFHSVECMFEHFMSYTGGFKETKDVQEKIKKAFFDGHDSSKGNEDPVPLFSAMGLCEVKMPSLIKKNDSLKSLSLPDENEISFIATEMSQEHDWDDLRFKEVYCKAFESGARYFRAQAIKSISTPD